MARSSSVQRKAGGPQWVVLAALGLIGVLVAISTVLVVALRDQTGRNQTGAQIGGRFALIDDDGKPFTDAELKGKWHLVFFGYTHCPDICPTALNDLSLALDGLGTAKGQVGIVFISVDPARGLG